MSRNAIWRVLLVCAVALLVFANVGLWVNRGIADEARFTEAAGDVLEQNDVRRAIAESIVREALAQNPPLYRMARQPAEIGVADLLATRGMQATLQIVARQLHRMLMTDERPRFVITSQLFQAIALAVAFVAPLQAATLTFDGTTTEVELFARQDIPRYGPYVDSFRIGAPLAIVGALALLVASVLAGANRARALKRVSYALFAAVAGTLLVIIPLRSAIVSGIDDEAARTVTTSVYNEFIWILLVQSTVLLVAGALLWVVASRMRQRVVKSSGVATTTT